MGEGKGLILIFYSCLLSQALFIAIVLVPAANSQAQAAAGSSCSYSMLITKITPCMNFLTNSTANGTSPTADCCSALASLTSSGTDCLCQLVSAGSALSSLIPINRTLAISLPRACNMAGVPLQCEASSSPNSAPGPVAFSPPAAVISPVVSPTATVPASSAPSLAPETGNSQALTPPSTAESSSDPLLPISAANRSPSLMSCFVLICSVTVMIFTKYC
ncbi:hypothetical protein Dimus_029014 [Dionaea muscipula]